MSTAKKNPVGRGPAVRSGEVERGARVEQAQAWLAWRGLVSKLQHLTSNASRDFAAALATLQPTGRRVPVPARPAARRHRP